MSPHFRFASCSLFFFGLLSVAPLSPAENTGGQQNPTAADMRELRHQDPQWQSVKLHLPDPATATAQQLETVGDVLRARRFPEDAIDYYNYALQRGGDE